MIFFHPITLSHVQSMWKPHGQSGATGTFQVSHKIEEFLWFDFIYIFFPRAPTKQLRRTICHRLAREALGTRAWWCLSTEIVMHLPIYQLNVPQHSHLATAAPKAPIMNGMQEDETLRDCVYWNIMMHNGKWFCLCAYFCTQMHRLAHFE